MAKKDPCWKGYKQVGMKKKNGREVPNCVPVKEGRSKNLNEFLGTALAGTKGAADAEKGSKLRKAVGSGAGYAVGAKGGEIAGNAAGKAAGEVIGDIVGKAAGKSATFGIGLPGAGLAGKAAGGAIGGTVGKIAGGVAGGLAGSNVGNKLAGGKNKDEKVKEERIVEYSAVVRQGIKMGGKKGGRLAQKGEKAAIAKGQQVKADVAKGGKDAGKYEKRGALIGSIAGAASGGFLDGPLPVGDIVGGIAGGKLGGKVGKYIDNRKAKKEKATNEVKEDTLVEKNVPTNPSLWSKMKSRAKAKFDVYPSAYANGWAAKEYKKAGGGWKTQSESVVREDLRQWFGKGGEGGVGGGGWDRYNEDGERVGKCAREEGEPKPKCLSKEKAAKMSKDEIGNAVRRKREEDPVADRKGKGGKPKMVSNKIGEAKTFEQFMEDSTPAWQRKAGKDPSGGLNKKGVESYRRENPGSKLQTAVTTKPSKLKAGSKSANRRKSFCARMSGMKKKLTSSKTANDPDSRINKSLRKWNC